jgi:hypothetical protein
MPYPTSAPTTVIVALIPARRTMKRRRSRRVTVASASGAPAALSVSRVRPTTPPQPASTAVVQSAVNIEAPTVSARPLRSAPSATPLQTAVRRAVFVDSSSQPAEVTPNSEREWDCMAARYLRKALHPMMPPPRPTIAAISTCPKSWWTGSSIGHVICAAAAPIVTEANAAATEVQTTRKGAARRSMMNSTTPETSAIAVISIAHAM